MIRHWNNADIGIIGVYSVRICCTCTRKHNAQRLTFNMVYIFASTSKVSFPGSGVSAIATSQENMDYIPDTKISPCPACTRG